MEVVFADFETYYAKDYSLRHMPPPEYILDPRFEEICLGVAVNAEPAVLVNGPDIQAWFAARDPKKTIMVTYNALFDQAIAAWRYGFVPIRMVDVLGMARCLLSYRLRSLSLDKTAEYLKAGQKGDAIKNVVGLHRADIIAQGLWPEFTAYCLTDVELLRNIFLKLRPEFPPSEYTVLDLVLRAGVEPRFRVDTSLLEEHLVELRAIKEGLLQSAGTDRDTILGNGSFIKLLEQNGVEIEYKDGKAGPIPAIAKTDSFMTDLQEHADPVVQALAAARLGFKSTIEETRSERLLNIAKVFEPSRMPVPLRYAGARTHRFSGEWKINAQNLPRGSKLRKALQAAPGSTVIVGDLAQIECRLAAWLAGAEVLVGAFARGEDPYKIMATHIFNTKLKDVTTFQRWVAKQATLGLQYGMGAPKFYKSVLRTARAQGMDMALLRDWSEELAQTTVDVYRSVNFQIKDLWGRLNAYLDTNWRGIAIQPVKVGPVRIGHNYEHKYGYVLGPSGLELRYNKPRRIKGQLYYDFSEVPTKIYGSALLENICQHLAGVLIKGTMLRMAASGHNFVHQCHDELVYIVPSTEVDSVAKLLLMELTRVPEWAAGLPLAADIKVGPTYGELQSWAG